MLVERFRIQCKPAKVAQPLAQAQRQGRACRPAIDLGFAQTLYVPVDGLSTRAFQEGVIYED